MAYTNPLYTQTPMSMAPLVNYSPTAGPYYSLQHEQHQAWSYDQVRAGGPAQSIGEASSASPQTITGDRPPHKRMREQEYNVSVPPSFHTTGQPGLYQTSQGGHTYGNYVPTSSLPPQEMSGHINTYQQNAQPQVTQPYAHYSQTHALMAQLPFNTVSQNFTYNLEAPISGIGQYQYSGP